MSALKITDRVIINTAALFMCVSYRVEHLVFTSTDCLRHTISFPLLPRGDFPTPAVENGTGYDACTKVGTLSTNVFMPAGA